MLDELQVTGCYARANAARFRVSRQAFADVLQASVDHAFGREAQSERGAVNRYLASLHLEDLAVASACASGDEDAWELFVSTYRPVLYRAAQAIDPSGGARDLADSLYAELYGLGNVETRNREDTHALTTTSAGRRSLFRYFHGRSSLATWLRAVLAQRHVDRLREQRRIAPLPDEAPPAGAVALAPNPEHGRYVTIMRAALTAALSQLPAEDRLRLSCYYDRQMTLAGVGRLTGEHESTVSRQLARTRGAIRTSVEAELRDRHGFDEAETAHCFRSVADDPGLLDIEELLGSKNAREVRSKDESCA
jgi:RNA polymerase sigma factor (sigma-70 family)